MIPEATPVAVWKQVKTIKLSPKCTIHLHLKAVHIQISPAIPVIPYVCEKQSWADKPHNLNSFFNFQMRSSWGKCQMTGYSCSYSYYRNYKISKQQVLKLQKHVSQFTNLCLFSINTCKPINYLTKTEIVRSSVSKNWQCNQGYTPFFIKPLIDLLLYQLISIVKNRVCRA